MLKNIEELKKASDKRKKLHACGHQQSKHNLQQNRNKYTAEKKLLSI